MNQPPAPVMDPSAILPLFTPLENLAACSGDEGKFFMGANPVGGPEGF